MSLKRVPLSRRSRCTSRDPPRHFRDSSCRTAKTGGNYSCATKPQSGSVRRQPSCLRTHAAIRKLCSELTITFHNSSIGEDRLDGTKIAPNELKLVNPLCDNFRALLVHTIKAATKRCYRMKKNKLCMSSNMFYFCLQLVAAVQFPVDVVKGMQLPSVT